MTKIAEQIVHDILDEITDVSALAGVIHWMKETELEILTQKLVGIVDENLERQLQIGAQELIKQLGELE